MPFSTVGRSDRLASDGANENGGNLIPDRGGRMWLASLLFSTTAAAGVHEERSEETTLNLGQVRLG